MSVQKNQITREISISLIDIPEDIDRDEIDTVEIRELADSIREIGLLQPIVLRTQDSRYELIGGHRRLMAVSSLGSLTVLSIVKTLTDKEAVLARAVENLQRVNLTVIEEARAYSRMVNKLGMSIDEIAKMSGRSAGMVRRKLSLLKLLPILQEAVHKGSIIYSVAEELNSLGDPGKIEYYLGYCVDHGVTLPVVRAWVQEEKQKQREALIETGSSGGDVVIPRSVPTYVPCNLCDGPMAIGQETVIRCCPDCWGQLQKIIKGV